MKKEKYTQVDIVIEGGETHSIGVKKGKKVALQIGKIINGDPAFKGEWKDSPASGFQIEKKEKGKTLYFHPENFTIKTEEKEQEVTEIITKGRRRKELKEKLKNEDLTLAEINELLRG